MSLAQHHHPTRRPVAHARRRPRHGLLAYPMLLLFAGATLSACYIAYVLWPRWPSEPVSLDAPAIPITIGEALFNIPPAAIRRPVQRRPGMQDRVDLAYLWPSLTPPDPAVRPEPVSSSNAIDRIFVTIADSGGALPATERIKTIYPRYLDNRIAGGPGTLASRPFRDGTPYQGEELLYDAAHPDGFLVRCTRNGAKAVLGMCLYERRIGKADVTVRFPRDWLEDWPPVAANVDRLIASFRASAR